jgi:hypothetical protein
MEKDKQSKIGLSICRICAFAISILFISGCGPSEEDLRLTDKEIIITLIQKCKGTPAEFRANYLLHPSVRDKLRLKGVMNAPQNAIENGRENLRKIYADIETGLNWKEPIPQIKIPYVKKSPQIDGKIKPEEWRNSYAVVGSFKLGSPRKNEASDEKWKLMWDEDFIYISLSFRDKKLIAPKMERDSKIYSYDCMEIFIMTEPRLKAYWEIVLSPSMSVFDSLHVALEKGAWDAKIYESVKGLRFAVDVKHDSQGGSECTIEAAVPWNEMPGYMKGNKPKHGDYIRLNLLRLDLNSEKTAKPDYFSFQPLLYEGHNIYGMTNCELTNLK